MNKFGGFDMTIKIGIGLVLGIILLLFSLSVGSTFLGIFFQEPSDLTEKSIINLESLINNLNSCEGNSFPFSMSGGYYLVAFDKSKLGRSGSEGYYSRPSNECYDSACLIICSASDKVGACDGSIFVISFEDIEKFEVKSPGNSGAGIVSYEEEKMINLYVARNRNNLILKEFEDETIEELNQEYLSECVISSI
jgi:hypothetical protein